MTAGGRAWRGLLFLLQRRRSLLANGRIPKHLDTQQRQAARKIPCHSLQSAGPWAAQFNHEDVDMMMEAESTGLDACINM
eukprot:1246525-Prorocentrum_lima.AAC.1